MIKNNQVYAGTFAIKLNGQEVPEYLIVSTEEVSVKETVNEPTMFTIKYKIGDFLKKINTEKIDVDVFKPGDEINISMGFDDIQPITTGEVYSVEPTYQEPFIMEVRGYDRLRRLSFESCTSSSNKQKVSDIATRFAQNAGLTPDVEDTGTVMESLFQNQQNNYQYLAKFAKEKGYEMFVDDKTFIFRKSKEDNSSGITLTYGKDLHSFSVRKNVVPAQSKETVKSWDPKNKKEITHTAETEVPEFIKKHLFPHQPGDVKCQPISSDQTAVDPADAERMANARLEARLKNLITGEGKCCGDNRIRSGQTLEIMGIADSLVGNYYVTSSTHTINEDGYSTTFEVRKTIK